MKKTFGTYYAKFTVAVAQPDFAPGGNNILQQGIIFIGARFQESLFTNGKFYKQLGFQTLTEIRDSENEGNNRPTCLKLKSSDAQQLNVFKLYQVSLVPKDSSKTIPQLGKKFNTRFPSSCELSEVQTRDIIYSKEFVFQSEGSTVTYVVLENSLMNVRRKATAAHIAKVRTNAENERPSDEEFISD